MSTWGDDAAGNLRAVGRTLRRVAAVGTDVACWMFVGVMYAVIKPVTLVADPIRARLVRAIPFKDKLRALGNRTVVAKLPFGKKRTIASFSVARAAQFLLPGMLIPMGFSLGIGLGVAQLIGQHSLFVGAGFLGGFWVGEGVSGIGGRFLNAVVPEVKDDLRAYGLIGRKKAKEAVDAAPAPDLDGTERKVADVALSPALTEESKLSQMGKGIAGRTLEEGGSSEKATMSMRVPTATVEQGVTKAAAGKQQAKQSGLSL